jgi:hypothetical protein
MDRLPVATSASSTAPGLSGPADTWVNGVVLLGVKVTARLIINAAEHLRRKAMKVTAITDPALLDRLLNLPIGVPLTDPVIWTELTGRAPGIIVRHDDGATVTRQLRSPLTIEDVVVHRPSGREVAAVQDASLFAGYTRRWVMTSHQSVPESVELEAKLCGVGVVDPNHQVLLPAEHPAALTVDAWSWLLQEKVYRRWLNQRVQDHATGTPSQATGEASGTSTG